MTNNEVSGMVIHLGLLNWVVYVSRPSGVTTMWRPTERSAYRALDKVLTTTDQDGMV